jgi:hypothetical protein
MDDYVTKPVRHSDLADTLRRWIPHHSDEPAQPPFNTEASSQTDRAAGLPPSSVISAR